jgi:putative serine protease PepD
MFQFRIKPLFFLTLFSFLIGLWGQGEAQALTDDEKNNVNIYQKASPSVVNVISTVITRDFFLNAIPREGSGSGSFIDARGHVLTNNHVIRDAKKLEVTLADGSKWPAKLVGTDPDNDLAVIKIDAPADKLKPLPLGDSQRLQVGQKVLAIGNPFGLGLTLTTGIISFWVRNIRSEVGTMIEPHSDRRLHQPGNSGGPLEFGRGDHRHLQRHRQSHRDQCGNRLCHPGQHRQTHHSPVDR